MRPISDKWLKLDHARVLAPVLDYFIAIVNVDTLESTKANQKDLLLTPGIANVIVDTRVTRYFNRLATLLPCGHANKKGQREYAQHFVIPFASLRQH